MGCLGSSVDLDQAQLIVTGLAHVSLIKCRSGRQLCDVAGVFDVFGGPDGCWLSRMTSAEMAGTTLLSSVFMLHLSNRLAGSYTHGNRKKVREKVQTSRQSFKP